MMILLLTAGSVFLILMSFFGFFVGSKMISSAKKENNQNYALKGKLKILTSLWTLIISALLFLLLLFFSISEWLGVLVFAISVVPEIIVMFYFANKRKDAKKLEPSP